MDIALIAITAMAIATAYVLWYTMEKLSES